MLRSMSTQQHLERSYEWESGEGTGGKGKTGDIEVEGGHERERCIGSVVNQYIYALCILIRSRSLL